MMKPEERAAVAVQTSGISYATPNDFETLQARIAQQVQEAEEAVRAELGPGKERDDQLLNLANFAMFVLKWTDRGPPHGGPGNEAIALDAIRHHPIVAKLRKAVAEIGAGNKGDVSTV